MKFKKWMLIAAGVVVLSGGGLAWVSLSGRGSTSQAQAYATVAVRRGPIAQAVKGTGSVTSSLLQNVMIKVGGNLSELLVKEGDKVTAGQVLARLDSRDVDLSLQKSRLNLKKLQNQLDSYNQNTRDLEVKAPADGVLRNLAVTEGQSVQEGALLAKVFDEGYLKLDASLNSSQVGAVTAGQPAEVFLPDFYSSVPGKVERLNRVGSAGSQGGVLFSVTVRVENPGALKAGMQAGVSIKTPQGEQQSIGYSQLYEPDPKEVRAGVSGKVEKLVVREGDAVKRGQQLMALVNDSLAQNIETQRLSIEQAKLDVQSGERTLSDMNVVSPISGTVIDLPVKLGDELKMGAQLATVADYSKMEVVVPIDELDVAKVHPGMEAEVTADALPGKTFQGSVEKIAEQGKVQSGVATFDVTLSIQQPEGLKVGMTINASLILGRKDDALLLPAEAVQTQNGRSFVLVKSDGQQPASPAEGGGRSQGNGGSGGQAGGRTGGTNGGTSGRTGGVAGGAGMMAGVRPVEIKTGLSSDTMVEVVSGLSEGQEVLIVGTSSSQANQMRGFGGGLFGGMRIQGGGGGNQPSRPQSSNQSKAKSGGR